MLFSSIIQHPNPSKKRHSHSAQNSEIKFYTQKSAKVRFLRLFWRPSPNFATDLLQTTEKGASYAFHYHCTKVNLFHFCDSKARRYKKKPLTFSSKRLLIKWSIVNGSRTFKPAYHYFGRCASSRGTVEPQNASGLARELFHLVLMQRDAVQQIALILGSCI